MKKNVDVHNIPRRTVVCDLLIDIKGTYQIKKKKNQTTVVIIKLVTLGQCLFVSREFINFSPDRKAHAKT